MNLALPTMNRRQAKKILRHVNSCIVDWRDPPYSVGQERRALLVWHRALRPVFHNDNGQRASSYSNGKHGERPLVRGGTTWVQRWEHWACARGRGSQSYRGGWLATRRGPRQALAFRQPGAHLGQGRLTHRAEVLPASLLCPPLYVCVHTSRAWGVGVTQRRGANDYAYLALVATLGR